MPELLNRQSMIMTYLCVGSNMGLVVVMVVTWLESLKFECPTLTISHIFLNHNEAKVFLVFNHIFCWMTTLVLCFFFFLTIDALSTTLFLIFITKFVSSSNAPRFVSSPPCWFLLSTLVSTFSHLLLGSHGYCSSFQTQSSWSRSYYK